MTSNKIRHPEPLSISGEKEMPYFTLALATMEWNNTGSWRYLRPRYVELTPACQHSCPTSNDIESWIRLSEKGKYSEAWSAAIMENPFPSIMGRVCFHPCMNDCNRKEMGGAVNIVMLERALGDRMGRRLPVPKPHFPSSGKSIAVVGSGPAGLACAYHMTRLGHRAVVFERQPKIGGMLRYGIPAYRLPREILDREIDMLQSMGIQFRTGKGIADAEELESLARDFNAVFLATGASKSRSLGIDGEKNPGVMTGLEFLHKVSDGVAPPIGRRVLVIGGGNTAVDSARSARRLGASVKIIYRRSRAEMPAFEEEINQAIEEGVEIEVLLTPKKITQLKERTIALACQQMKLGLPDESGRRKPLPAGGKDVTFEAELVLIAVGEDIDTRILPADIRVENGSVAAGRAGVAKEQNIFAGGDLIPQPRTVVSAMGSGKRGAIAIDCKIRGENFDEVFEKIRVADTEAVFMSSYVRLRGGRGSCTATTSETENPNRVAFFDSLNPAYFAKSSPAVYPKRTIEERFEATYFIEVNMPPPDKITAGETARCFHCGRCTECDNCYIYCPDVAILKKEGGFEIDRHFCKGCGVCVNECPRAAMDLIEEPMEI